MRMKLASQAWVDTAVTLAAAALMTIAGFEMLEGLSSPPRSAGAQSAPAAAATPHAGHAGA